MPESLVVLKHLTKKFGDFTALNGCSLTIHQGEVFGLLGPNGAGKSTMLRLLLGFLSPTEGTARVSEFCCHQQRVEAHRQMTYLPGDARLYRLMRAKNLLRMFCDFRPDACFETAISIADRLELDLSRWVGLMSTGMRQKLALSICLANQAPVVILDEPTANLDPTVREKVLEMVRESKSAGKTVIFSSHVLTEIEETCDRVGILRRGELVHVESIEHLKTQHRILATLKEVLPDIPEQLVPILQIKQDGDRVQIETSADLSSVLGWLASANLADISIQPVGLRSVYDRFHHPNSIVSQTEAES